MSKGRPPKKMAKFLAYVLGRRPDEFGLVPDENGYVKTKDLMKVLAEEPGWRHVRFNQIREMIHSSRSPSVEIEKNLIRAVDRAHLILPQIPDILPKLLYYPVRQRAYPAILENGLRSSVSGQRIVLADDDQHGRGVDEAGDHRVAEQVDDAAHLEKPQQP